MAVNYFQDTIFNVGSALTAPGNGTAVQVAVNNFFATTNNTLVVKVASKNTNVVIRLEGSIDGSEWVTILANTTISSNGNTIYTVADTPLKWIRPVFVSEAGGTDATVTFHLAAL